MPSPPIPSTRCSHGHRSSQTKITWSLRGNKETPKRRQQIESHIPTESELLEQMTPKHKIYMMDILKAIKEDISNMNKNRKRFQRGDMSYEKGEILMRDMVQVWPRQGAPKMLAGMTAWNTGSLVKFSKFSNIHKPLRFFFFF